MRIHAFLIVIAATAGSCRAPTTIRPGPAPATVMVVAAVVPEQQAELLRLIEASQPVFAAQPGFVSSSVHRSTDGARVVHYLQWRSVQDHHECMNSKDWQGDEGKDLMRFIQSGKAKMDVHVYEVVSVRSTTP